MIRRSRWLLGLAAVVVLTAIVVAAAVWVSMPRLSAQLRTRAAAALSAYFQSDVELESFSFSVRLHRLTASGTGLVIRHRGRRDVPPLIEVKSFTATMSPRHLWHREIDHVLLDGLKITIAPRRDAEDTNGTVSKGTPGESAEARVPADANSAAVPSFLLSALETRDAELRILRKDPTRTARLWRLHYLRLSDISRDASIPFETILSNAIPPGEIAASGHFGPWNRSDPGQAPIDGRFTFDNADLSVFEGISGILAAEGQFDGILERISILGRTSTPDFLILTSGHKVPLQTEYHAVVDGTNGNTILDPVRATFFKTSLTARGGVYDTPGPIGRVVNLDVTVDNGQLEDLMTLAVPTPRSPMTGRVQVQTRFVIPPGKGDIVDKLQLNGAFSISNGRFTDPGVRAKVTDLSGRARGAPGTTDSVASGFSGRVILTRGLLTLNALTFNVPGAIVELDGGYAIRKQTIDFQGNLFMDAKLSQTTTGFKSLLLKIVDPIFRKNGRTVVPLRISGMRNDPQFSVDFKRVFRRGDDVRPRSVPSPSKKPSDTGTRSPAGKGARPPGTADAR